MNNMYDILKKINLLEGRGSKPDYIDLDKDGDKKEPMKKAAADAKKKSVDEGAHSQGAMELNPDFAQVGKKPGIADKIKAGVKKVADVIAPGDEEYVRRLEKSSGGKRPTNEAKKPDFLDLDKDGDKKEPMKKAAKDKKSGAKQAFQKQMGGSASDLTKGLSVKKKKSVKESIRLIKEGNHAGRSAQIYHDAEYQEFTVCLTQAGKTQKMFTESSQAADATAEIWLIEGKSVWPGSDEYKRRFGQDKEAFRLRHAPSVMKDPEARKELGKMDAEHERTKKMRRGEIDPDDNTGAAAGEKRGRGRPKGSTRSIGAKGPSGQSKLMKKGAIKESADGIDEILANFPREVEMFKRGGELDQDLEEALWDYHYNRGTIRNYNADASAFIAQDLADHLGLNEDVGSEFTAADWKKVVKLKHKLMQADPSREPEDAEQEAVEILGYDYDEVLAWLDSDENLEEADYSAKRAVAGKDIGKPGKNFEKIAKSSGERYGSKAAGERVAGAVLNKLRSKNESIEESKDDVESAIEMLKKAGYTVSKDKKQVDEKVKSPYAVGMAQAMKSTGDKPPLKKSTITKAHEIAKKVDEEDTDTKPQKKKKEVDETTTSGSVATGGDAAPKSKGGVQFGKGVYEARLAESFDKQMKTVMTESVNVTVNANSEGSNTVTVTGKDVTPDVLVDLLKMAGMQGAPEEVYKPVDVAAPPMTGGDAMSSMLNTLDGIGGEQEMPESAMCEQCGGHEGMHEAECSRQMAVEGDLANSGDNTENMSTDYMVNKLAGGLNGPKKQVNPNNKGDNPLAMRDLGKTAHSLSLGTATETVKEDAERRLWNLFKEYTSK